jgi:hypothetical protein
VVRISRKRPCMTLKNTRKRDIIAQSAEKRAMIVKTTKKRRP